MAELKKVLDLVKKLETRVVSLETEKDQLKAEQVGLKEEVSTLKSEVSFLKNEVSTLEKNLDKVEQYNRKSSLILGGAFPGPLEDETPEVTRGVAIKVIEEKLKVKLNGGISACHRLKNKKRVLIQFQDLADRDAVYQAKFEQRGDAKQKIAVNDNLTEKRGKLITILEDLRRNGHIANYHSRNGNVMARCSPDKRYVNIEINATPNDIMSLATQAPPKHQYVNHAHQQFNQSQTLADIPPGRVAQQAAGLQEYVVPGTRRSTRT